VECVIKKVFCHIYIYIYIYIYYDSAHVFIFSIYRPWGLSNPIRLKAHRICHIRCCKWLDMGHPMSLELWFWSNADVVHVSKVWVFHICVVFGNTHAPVFWSMPFVAVFNVHLFWGHRHSMLLVLFVWLLEQHQIGMCIYTIYIYIYIFVFSHFFVSWWPFLCHFLSLQFLLWWVAWRFSMLRNQKSVCTGSYFCNFWKKSWMWGSFFFQSCRFSAHVWWV